jgi:hypothetical protein
MGLYFIALIPTSGMTAAWTGLANGDLESALVAMAVNLLAAVAILPVYLSVLIPGSVGFDPTALYRQLAQVVVAAETLPLTDEHSRCFRHSTQSLSGRNFCFPPYGTRVRTVLWVLYTSLLIA